MGTIFSATDIRGYVGKSLTTEYVWNVGKAFAEWLSVNGPVVVVRAESTHERTAEAFAEGVLLQGRNIVDAGQGDQPKVIAAIIDNQAAGGVLVEYEPDQDMAVLTLFDERGLALLDSSGLAEITELVDAGNFLPGSTKGETKSV